MTLTLNTHPGVYWFSLPKPTVCLPFLLYPPLTCLLFTGIVAFLYGPATSLTWDNQETKNVITLTLDL